MYGSKAISCNPNLLIQDVSNVASTDLSTITKGLKIGQPPLQPFIGSGTISYTPGDDYIIGVGTKFLTETRIGDQIFGTAAANLNATILNILDDTRLVANRSATLTYTNIPYSITPAQLLVYPSYLDNTATMYLKHFQSTSTGTPETSTIGAVNLALLGGFVAPGALSLALRAQRAQLGSGLNVAQTLYSISSGTGTPGAPNTWIQQPVSLTGTNQISNMVYQAYDGYDYRASSQIQSFTDSNVAASQNAIAGRSTGSAGFISCFTTPANTTAPIENMRVMSNGCMLRRGARGTAAISIITQASPYTLTVADVFSQLLVIDTTANVISLVTPLANTIVNAQNTVLTRLAGAVPAPVTNNGMMFTLTIKNIGAQTGALSGSATCTVPGGVAIAANSSVVVHFVITNSTFGSEAVVCY